MYGLVKLVDRVLAKNPCSVEDFAPLARPPESVKRKAHVGQPMILKTSAELQTKLSEMHRLWAWLFWREAPQAQKVAETNRSRKGRAPLAGMQRPIRGIM